MNFTEYFYQNWLDKLVTVIGVILGVVSGVAILISKISESIKAFKVCTDDVKERGKELMDANDNTKELNEKLKDSLAEIEECSAETKRLNENYKEMQAKVCKENQDIKKALLIAFSSNSELVKQGRADEITKILKGDNDEIIDETAV